MARRRAPAGSLQSTRSAAEPRRRACCPPRRIQESRNQFDALCRIGSGAGHSRLVCFRRTRADIGRGAGPCPQPRVSRCLQPETSARCTACSNATRRCCGHRRGAATRIRRCWPRSFGNARLSSAGALAVSLVRRLASMASPPRVETQPWLPLESGRHRRSGRRGRRQRAQRERASTIPPASGRCSSSVSRAAEASSSPKARQRGSSGSFPGSTQPAIVFSEYRDTAVRLRYRIAAMGRQVVLLHGGLTPDERAAVDDGVFEGWGGDGGHGCRVGGAEPASLAAVSSSITSCPGRRRGCISGVAASTASGNGAGCTRSPSSPPTRPSNWSFSPCSGALRDSGAFIRGSIVHQLPEALVARRFSAAIRSSGPAHRRAAGAHAEPFITLDLSAEARAEVERLRMARLVEPRGGSSAGLVIPVTLQPRASG